MASLNSSGCPAIRCIARTPPYEMPLMKASVTTLLSQDANDVSRLYRQNVLNTLQREILKLVADICGQCLQFAAPASGNVACKWIGQVG